jgi:hypothetical protein
MGEGKSAEMAEPASFFTVVIKRGKEEGGIGREAGEVNRRDVGSAGMVFVP